MKKHLEWTKMIDVLYEIKNDQSIIVYWDDGLIAKCLSSWPDETYNDLEMDDPNYLEYYMVNVKIQEIINMPPNTPEHRPYSYSLKPGGFAELSIRFEPEKIELENGKIIWQKGDNEGWSLEKDGPAKISD